MIIRLSSIGDIILTTPLIRAVRNKYPQAQIDFLVKKEFKPLVQHNPYLNNVISFDKKVDNLKDVKQRIRRQKYDWIIDIHKNFRSRYITTGLKSTRVTRYSKSIIKRQFLVWFGINTFGKVVPAYLKYFEAVKKDNIQYDGKGTDVFTSEEEQKKAHELLGKFGLGEEEKAVAICPGASFANKRWLPERFAKVGTELSKQGYKILFLGGTQDTTVCDDIIGLMEGEAINLAGKVSLLGSAVMLARCELAITNDSGLMHLAQSQKVPVVAIFGPTTRELGYFPFPESSYVVETTLNCRPCTHNGLDKCPKGHFKCMRELKEDQVLDAANQLFTA